jgi:hypothetical protein
MKRYLWVLIAALVVVAPNVVAVGLQQSDDKDKKDDNFTVNCSTCSATPPDKVECSTCPATNDKKSDDKKSDDKKSDDKPNDPHGA